MSAGPAGAWHRLHPMSPVVRSGRGVLAVAAAVAISSSAGGGGGSRWFDLALPIAAAVAAVVSWLVTRWRLDGVTLRIESGLIRRDSRQLPIARIQAVDVVRPFLARALGLAELRVRLAGSSHADGRLAYLTEQAALELRARLLAAHHGIDPATPEPAEHIALVVPTGRLVTSVLMSSSGSALLVVLAGTVLAIVSPAGFAALAVTLLWWLITCVSLVWRRVSAQYGFTVAQSPDGIRIRRGLIGTVHETIPVPRVQAVRMIEPLLWRQLGWCRLEVDVAGSPGRDSADGTSRMRKALLPVGRRDEAGFLLAMVVGGAAPFLTRPPRRARWKAPLSYHFLAAGYDNGLAVSVVGRIRKVTTVVPLEKAQSVRFVQGPLQRRLALASVHLDAAGHVRAEFRERPQAQARQLVDELAALSREARRHAPPPGHRLASGQAASAQAASAQAASAQAASAQAASAQAASVVSPVNAAQSEA